jgi:hypothetical protein
MLNLEYSTSTAKEFVTSLTVRETPLTVDVLVAAGGINLHG